MQQSDGESLGGSRGGHGDFEDSLTSAPPDVVSSDPDVEDLPSTPLVSTSGKAPFSNEALPTVEVEEHGENYGE